MHGVLAGRRIQHKQRLARGGRQFAGDNAVDLGQLVHQIGFVVQTARGIDDDDIAFSRLDRRDRIEHNGGGIRARPVADDIRARAPRPDLKLIRSSRTERIRGGQHDLFAFRDIARGKLTDAGRFTDAVDADD